MNGETAYQFMFICELKIKKVGDHHFHDHVTVPALRVLPQVLQVFRKAAAMSATATSYCQVRPVQKTLHMYLTPKKVDIKTK